MMGEYIMFTLFLLLVNGVYGAESVEVKVMEGDSVPLKTSVTKGENDTMLWYFEDTRIALINGQPSNSCLYYGEDGRFRDRLEMDYKTGSLTITNIRSEHAGRYEAQLNIKKISGTSTSLNKNPKCNSTTITRKSSSTLDDTIKTFKVSVTVPGSGLSSGAVAGIVTVLVVCVAAAVAGVIHYRRRSFRKDVEKKNREFL